MIDPRANITIESIATVFHTLVNQTGHSNINNGLEQEVNEWVRWAAMNPNLYGDPETTEKLKKAFATTTDYLKQKKSTVMQFFSILSAHPEARVCALADIIKDTKIDKDTFCFCLLVGGAKTPSKQYIVNSAMTIFSINLCMLNKNDDSILDLATMTPKQKAMVQYQPSTHATFYKHIFLYLKTKGVAFEQSNFTGIKGKSSFNLYFNFSFLF